MSALKKPKEPAPVPAAPAFTVLPPPTAAPSPFRKLKLAPAPAAAGKSAKVYPVLADPDGAIAELAAAILDNSAKLDALEGALDVDKRELRTRASHQYFPLLRGRGEIPSSIEAHTADGRKLRVGFINKYAAVADEGPLVAILGEHAGTLLRQTIKFKVDCDKVPEAALEPLYTELVALFARHGCPAALTHTEGIVPTKDFHTLRHTLLTPEQNLQFDQLCPVGTQVKVKGLGNKDAE
jgi:hypothetical protein